jgi:hypothetical protein
LHSIRYRAVRTVGRGIVPKIKTARAGALAAQSSLNYAHGKSHTIPR